VDRVDEITGFPGPYSLPKSEQWRGRYGKNREEVFLWNSRAGAATAIEPEEVTSTERSIDSSNSDLEVLPAQAYGQVVPHTKTDQLLNGCL